MSTQTATVDREIRTARIVNAPRELVWNAWTDPQQISKWWGPTGFSTTTSEHALKPGGVWRFVMHGADGRAYPNRIVFTDVIKPKRLHYKHTGEADFDDIKFEAYVTFEADGSQTKITLHSVFATKQERDYVVKEFGAVEGAQQTLERFAGHLMAAQSSGAKVKVSTPSTVEARIVRIMKAPRDLVFEAWTQPKHIVNWMLGPAGWTMPVCEVDLRPGGVWKFVWRKSDGSEMPMHGVYRTILHPELLISTENWGEPWPETVNTVQLTERTGQTEICLTILYSSQAARDQAMQTGMEDGANSSFDRLETYLKGVK